LPNFNSIDLLDVEFAANGEGEKMLQELRDGMVAYQIGDKQNVLVNNILYLRPGNSKRAKCQNINFNGVNGV